MGALAEDEDLMALDGSNEVDNRRACRPFGNNCGFTLAEAAVYVVLADDALALEMGCHIHGAVAGVFVNADGFKQSIPSPGVGNYITVAKALALGCAILAKTPFAIAPTSTPTAPAHRRTGARNRIS